MKVSAPSLLTAAILATPFATAQTSPLQLDTQRVSGQLFANTIAEQAFAVEVLERSDIARLPVMNIADALEWVGGLDVRQRGSGGTQVDLGIRGAGYEQTLILLDGVRMNNPQTGHFNFDLPVVLEDIERIEVVRGPGAGQYGPNGNAGVINLVTRKAVATENGRQAGVKLEAGSYEYLRGVISLGKTSGNWSNFVAGQQQQADSYIAGADLGYKTRQGNYRLSYQGQQHSTVLGLGYVDKAFGAQGFYGPASARANEQTIQRHAYLTHDVRLNSGQGVDVALNYRQLEDRFYYLSYAPSVNQTDALQARLRYRLSQQLALGYEHNREEIDSTSVTGNQRQRNYDSAFVYGQYDVGPIQLAGSWSYLTYDDGDSYSLPVLGLTLPLGAHQLYLNGGKSVRVPTMNDLYLNQAANKGNPLVKPEQTSSAELGARLNLAGVQTRLAVFTRDTEDAIDYTRSQQDIDSNISYYTARNIRAIDTRGADIELDASALLAQQGWQKVSLSYTWLDQDFTNQYPQARYTQSQLRHQAILALAYEVLPQLTLTSLYKYEERYDQAGYQLWDLGLKKQYDGWHWAVALSNALDEDYIDSGFIAAPGRSLRVELAAGF